MIRKPVYEANLLDTILALQQRIDSLEKREGVPIGSIFAWGGVAAPIGYLLCDGASYKKSRVSEEDFGYPELFTVIGNIYGFGNGVDEFQVPDLRGRFLVGQDHDSSVDELRSIGASGGEIEHTLTIPEIPSHTHPPASGYEGFWQRDAEAGSVVGSGASFQANNAVGATGSTGGGGAHNNMPPFYTVTYVIAAL